MHDKKLLLFDIDGTLIRGHGVPKRLMIDAVRRFFPTYSRGEEVSCSGKTDKQIIREMLQVNQHDGEFGDGLLIDILDDFAADLSRKMTKENPPQLLPGVLKLVTYFHEHPDYYLGLVTGNIVQGARTKLEAVDLYRYFPLGGFGSDSENRDDLPPIAIKRAEQYYDSTFKTENVWIIGDTERDVQCAHSNGLRCIAVGTGNFDFNDLQTSGADFILKDLTNFEDVLSIINNN